MNEDDLILKPGQIVADMELVKLISIGGYGSVFEAVTKYGNGVSVALKLVPLRHDADRLAGKRFMREVRIIADSDHPNIVRFRGAGLHDVARERSGERWDDHFLWMSMELLVGKTLGEALAIKGRLSVQETLQILAQVTSALASLEPDGIVHRDIKPSNIFLVATKGDTPWVKLIDFGAAAHDGQSLGTGGYIGTVDYMAPDYIALSPRQRDSGKADSRWDQYALGLVAYRCITGEHPLRKPGEETPSMGAMLKRHREQGIPRLVELLDDCPPRVSACLERCVAKDLGGAVALGPRARGGAPGVPQGALSGTRLGCGSADGGAR